MSILQSKQTSYEFSLDEIKKLIASDLKINEDAIIVNYIIQEVGGDMMDRYLGTPTVTKIEVRVNELKKKVEI